MENLISVGLNVLGIVIFFVTRYAGRTDKILPYSGKFWIKSNWEQLIGVVLTNIGLMALVFQGGLKLNLEKLPMIPEWAQVAGDEFVALLVGALFAYLAYEGYKKLVIDKR